MKRNKNFTGKTPLLYLIATPIGNLSEFSNRAISIISECDIVAAEDTRNTKLLLSHFNIHKNLFSLREHNETQSSEYLIKEIKNGKKVCYVSDAGYPGISDPGNILVNKAIENDISVSTINGACAFLNGLVSSGLDTSHFYFHGFLSPKDNEATKELEQLKNRKETLIFYESPHRIKKTLLLLNKILGNRQFVIARELTKINEEFIRGLLNEVNDIDENSLIGEMVLIIQGNKNEEIISKEEIVKRTQYLKTKNISNKDIVEIISYEFKTNKNIIKKMLLEKEKN